MSVSEIPDRVIECSFAYGELAVGETLLVESMGYSARGCPEPIRLAVREALAEAEPQVSIQGGYRILPDEVLLHHNGAIDCGACHFQTDKIVAGQMKRSRRLAVFAVTIGDRLETRARELLRGDDPVKGYILDALASVIADGAADLLQQRIGNLAAEWSWKNTNRFSPGYCGWSVAQQHLLFAQLPPGFCGITLSETALMHPIKSVSGIIGLGPDVRCHPYPCDFCNCQDCYKRRRAASPATARGDAPQTVTGQESPPGTSRSGGR